jgi:hypothetical protein
LILKYKEGNRNKKVISLNDERERERRDKEKEKLEGEGERREKGREGGEE